ncbi:PqiC family protein [Paraburkholderia sp. CNPSo 3076]|uniref:PqiC family protein n=1 Tax=Paraburkholderia sp. CNPSo 3076 TaxID=2940936 RepID=UPI00224DBB35|nr:PqiC family protein [Paraburkholderia sp. CNPSo 3076]MCX5539791.1 PqiC family protein [Paraburkholderia sp. CNPSo 3076]
MTFRRVPALATLGALVIAAALAGCSSPASRFYTLSPSDDPARTAAAPSAGNAQWLIELAPVDVPPQVAKAQFVVQTDANQVRILEQERWSSMPGDEIRRALSGDLTQQLGTIDVYGSPHPEGVPVYRVSVNVQRFESWPGSHALIDAVWSVRALDTQTVLTCRSVLNEKVGDGYDALVIGHRQAVEALSQSIASGVRALAAAPRVSVAANGAKAGARAKPAPGPACPQMAAAGG